MASKAKEYSLFDPEILGPATIASLRKLAPQHVAKNPVMFVVEVGAVLTTILFAIDPSVFAGQITVWLWLTVLFANFAEAMAEARGKAQADALRKTKTDVIAKRLTAAACQATQTLTSLPTLPSQVNFRGSSFEPGLFNSGSSGALRLRMPMVEPSLGAML
jgi:high-affinity K+ transport system ATPase subunit B